MKQVCTAAKPATKKLNVLKPACLVSYRLRKISEQFQIHLAAPPPNLHEMPNLFNQNHFLKQYEFSSSKSKLSIDV